jgi:hypothetical protein
MATNESERVPMKTMENIWNAPAILAAALMMV